MLYQVLLVVWNVYTWPPPSDSTVLLDGHDKSTPILKKHIRGINHALAISIGLIEPIPSKLTLCLCGACADDFRSTGAFLLRQADPQQAEKEVCVYCRQHPGVDYIVTPKNTQAKGGAGV